MSENTYSFIRVQYVNPRQGNRPASIKDANGVFYTVSDAAVGYFQPGAEGDLGYYVNQRGYNVATAWNGQQLPRGDGQPPTRSPASAQQRQPPQQQPPQQQRPPQQRSADPQGAAKAEEMFVMGVVGRAMGSGKFGVADIADLAREATTAWKQRNNPVPPPSVYDGDPGPIDSDVNDEIPY